MLVLCALHLSDGRFRALPSLIPSARYFVLRIDGGGSATLVEEGSVVRLWHAGATPERA